jgi:hypothetical protein
MQAKGDIESSTMLYVFDMFGKSVAQMMQSSLYHDTAIDELRGQTRTLQQHVETINQLLQDIEDRLLSRLQEARPVVHTRDGVPLDDALDTIQKKLTGLDEKVTTHSETLGRMKAEVDDKLSRDEFQTAYKDTSEAAASISDLAMNVQQLNKELKRQRDDTDGMMDRCVQMVKLQIEQYRVQSSDDDDARMSQFVTHEQLKGILQANRLGGPDVEIDEDDPEAWLARLAKSRADLDDDYMRRRGAIDAQMKKARGMVGPDEDDFDIGSDFSVDLTDTDEHQFVDVGVDCDGGLQRGDSYARVIGTTGSRRNIGLSCSLAESAERRQRQAVTPRDQLEEQLMGRVDESRLTLRVSMAVMTRVEAMLVDMLATTGIAGVRFDRADAQVFVRQLSVLQVLKEDIEKLKLKMGVKMNKTDCERELSIRMTRDELLALLVSVFPGNAALQRAAGYKKKLPPLKKTDKNSVTDADESPHARHKRQIHTADAPQPLMPARNSRLLALNQKFLKGADGKYYLRDMGSDVTQVTSNVVGSSATVKVSVDQSLDFQPFLPMEALKPGRNDEELPERIVVPSQHRARTPEPDD